MPDFITPPKAFDPERVARVRAGLTEQGFASEEPLLDAVFGNSPFLGRLAQRETGALGEYFAAGPQTVVNAAVLLAGAVAHAESEAQAMKELRTAKRRAALAIAMADIAGLWEVEKVTAELMLEDNTPTGLKAVLRFPRTAIRAMPSAPLKSAAE